MFQTFQSTTRPDQGGPRLAALRQVMAQAGLDGYLIPRADAHQGEYVAPHDDRLAWLTGFTGSAGFCIALPQIAGVFIDGRYRLQVKLQVALDQFTPVPWPDTKPGGWLREQLPGGGTVGYDPWLHTRDELDKLEESLAGSGISLRPSGNLVDMIWPDQPAPPVGRVSVHPDTLAGESPQAKRGRLADTLRKESQRTAVLTLPDSLCWLLNIRGEDVPRNPVVHGFALLHDDASLTLFIDPAKLDAHVRAHLGPDVRLLTLADFEPALKATQGPVRVDRATAPAWVSDTITGAGGEVSWGEDPCILPKARKTAAEIAATTEAHLRDGAAMVEFLAWLDAKAPSGGLTEISVVQALEGFRRAGNELREISFDTICGSGPNAAIMHYRVTEETNRPVRAGELLLVDSGGQYVDGTTDITRTVAIGDPTDEQCSCFTKVLQGMIAISRARWPKGLAGRDLDSLARYNLWLAGLDYDHGTGHGVGVYLSVHEGPQRISRLSEVSLDPGLMLSIERGFFGDGSFGIRFVYLVVVREAPTLDGADARAMLAFDTLTYVPIDRRLIAVGALSQGERDWLNQYHGDVMDRIAPRLSAPALTWLAAATAAL